VTGPDAGLFLKRRPLSFPILDEIDRKSGDATSISADARNPTRWKSCFWPGGGIGKFPWPKARERIATFGPPIGTKFLFPLIDDFYANIMENSFPFLLSFIAQIPAFFWLTP
jgi:hypothetical protein